MMPAADLALGVLISGGGTTLQNLIDRIADGRLAGVRIASVISSRSAVEGVSRAQRAGLALDIIRVKDFPDCSAFSDEVAATLDARGVQLAVLAGWLPFWRLPARWFGRVINIHPSLLPRFGGKGFHGLNVHRAVLAAGCSESGATVHYVDNEYDHGPIIRQVRCPVRPGDTPETLAQRVGELERELLPAVIADLRDELAKRGGAGSSGFGAS